MLRVEKLSVSKGEFSLKELSFEIAKNSYFVILGKTGSGKTMLLESIAGINEVVGKIFFANKEITHLPPQKRDFGFVYQDFVLFPNLSVKENILYASKYKKIQNAKELFADIVSFLEIKELLNRDIRNLSGGEKQRVAIARAIYSQPKLLLLDEPLSAVDPTFRNSIMKSLKDIVIRYNTTIVHVTHNFREASYLADQISIMIDGKIVQYGDTNRVLNHPVNVEVANFLGFKNIFSTKLLGLNDDKVFSIDPNLILFSRKKDLHKYCFECEIEDIMGIMDHYKIFAKVAENLFFAKVPKNMFNKLKLNKGMHCFLCIKKEDIVVFDT